MAVPKWSDDDGGSLLHREDGPVGPAGAPRVSAGAERHLWDRQPLATGPRGVGTGPLPGRRAGSNPRLCWVSEGNPDREVQYRFSASAPSQAPQELDVGFAVQDCRYRFKVRWNGAIVSAYNFIGQREAGLEAGALPTIVDPRVNLA